MKTGKIKVHFTDNALIAPVHPIVVNLRLLNNLGPNYNDCHRTGSDCGIINRCKR